MDSRLAALFSLLLFCTVNAYSQLHIDIGATGRVVSMRDADGRQWSPGSNPGYLLQLVIGGHTIAPLSARVEKKSIVLTFPEGKTARIKEDDRGSYCRFEVTSVSAVVDDIIWGPVNTVIGDTIGQCVGVVRSADFAIGIQALNVKTSGGQLVNEEGAVFDRGTTAVAQPFGSSLQAFAVNRSMPRKITVWDHWPKAPVPAIPDGELKGSAIAVFGCKPAAVLEVIQTITRQENLPNATWAGAWIKTSLAPGRPYMITTFSEDDVDTFLNVAKRMGMAGVYHEDPFDTWGHFRLKPALFPHDRDGFKACVQKAHALGLRLGFHVLSNFITTNDPYVTPRPNPGLASAGIDTLADAISATTTEIPVRDSFYFSMRSDLNTVMIGAELIRYMAVTTTPPYRLTGCVRGSFGTAASDHRAGETVSRLIDHPYKVFFPGWQLQKEIAGNIARFINETGADQMDFDGHEGTYATGMGDCSLNTFAEEVFRRADHPVIFGSSRANHFFWHLNGYLNWGEPWYGGFRESQSDYRIANQQFYETNYLPNMLGWFLLTPQTTPADVDWMLARAAGYGAGYALVVRKEALTNPHLDEIIARIRAWTDATDSGRFNAEQKAWLRDPNHDAELVRTDKWYLRRFRKFQFGYQAKTLQPGQPTYEEYTFVNDGSEQTPQLILTADGESGTIRDPVVELDNSFRLALPVTLEAGQTIVIGDAPEAPLYAANGRFIRNTPLPVRLPKLGSGQHQLSFDAKMDASSPLKARIVIKMREKEEAL